MKQFETNVSIVMTYLKNEEFSASVISQHRICYRELSVYLASNMLQYSPMVAYQWIESKQPVWSYRKYTSYRHCIDQLNDVLQTGSISPDNFGPRYSAYKRLSNGYKETLDAFIVNTNCEDDRYRIAISRFLLYLQEHNVNEISEISYIDVINFHYDDYHKSSRSKADYEDQIRAFLMNLAKNNQCDIGLALVLNKLLIDKVITIPLEDLQSVKHSNETFHVSWSNIENFITSLKDSRYGCSVIKSSKHILTLMYIFLHMHQIDFEINLIWYWFDAVKPKLGSGYKQHRRSLFQFFEYLKNGFIVTAVTGNPEKVNSLDTLPEWISNPLNSYLLLLKREGRQPSTIAMQKSSNIRFGKYLVSIGICSFDEVTHEVLIGFNLHDKHSTPEGKAAYNCRIRSFIIYLYEQKLIEDAFLYKALPTFIAASQSLVETLTDVDVSAIWAVSPETLKPKELRDYAIVCIGLSMGFRASDIISLKFNQVDWKNKCISISQQKTGKLISMPMPVKTGNILYSYLKNGRPQSAEQYIFIRHEAPYNRIQGGVCRSALRRFLNKGISEPCKFHTVRKTFATELLRGNAKTTIITDSLGHSTDDTVHKYLSLDEDRMRLCPIPMSVVGISYKGGVFNA